MFPQLSFHIYDSKGMILQPWLHSQDSTAKIPKQAFLSKPCLGSRARVILYNVTYNIYLYTNIILYYIYIYILYYIYIIIYTNI